MGGEEPAFHIDDYDYDLPESSIAQAPCAARSDSRLLVLDRSTGEVEHRSFQDMVALLRPGDLLVTNDTRVVPARLLGRKESGGRVELLVLNPLEIPEAGADEGHECLVKSSKHLRAGSIVHLEDGVRAEFVRPLGEGKARVRFLTSEPLLHVLDRIGCVPLPPYIRRDGMEAPVDDLAAYQTVYAAKPGAVAAPTAGLHFSHETLGRLLAAGIARASVTLHVGYGTFAPIRTQDIREHRIHSEYVEVSGDTAEVVERVRSSGGRIVAVGTTVVRTLEWAARKSGAVQAVSGLCDHYIYPGYRFRVIDAMITNFHLPQSTLLLLVSAFAGREAVLDAYREAIERGYRFFSYGDAMLIA